MSKHYIRWHGISGGYNGSVGTVFDKPVNGATCEIEIPNQNNYTFVCPGHVPVVRNISLWIFECSVCGIEMEASFKPKQTKPEVLKEILEETSVTEEILGKTDF